MLYKYGGEYEFSAREIEERVKELFGEYDMRVYQIEEACNSLNSDCGEDIYNIELIGKFESQKELVKYFKEWEVSFAFRSDDYYRYLFL